MNSDKHIDDEVIGAGNGVEYTQVGGKTKRVNKSKRKSVLRKIKKNKTMKRKTVKKSKKGKKKSKK
tara:strand:- start:97 stop:294 length:198 start_codon:yes stop_codon:yes gene_type:complete